ncbi:hypothetical protein RHOSPDRAFT_35272 [Rhodotorula sp. JG-1b]|nr:hypothetical protein RHOSPDRAFT_35272 [Rhodotorula sp. JG-1b]
MPGAQGRFSSICPVSYSDYCSAPWQYQGKVCCGICPSPAIASYGTVAGLIVGSFFNMLIVLFQPDESAAFIGGQLTIAHMYLIAVFVRNMMGSASEGTNGMQKWHAEFAFLLGASITGVVLPAVLSDTHHIHGFSSHEHLLDSLRRRDNRANLHSDNAPHPRGVGSAPTRTQTNTSVPGSESHLPRRFAPKIRHALQQTRKGLGGNQAVIIFATFSASELLWFIAYGVTVWWGTQTTFWQSQCDEMVGGGLIQGVSITFVSLSFLFTLLLIIPVFFPTSRYKSAAHFIVLLLSHHAVRHRTTVATFRRAKQRARARLGLPPGSDPRSVDTDAILGTTLEQAEARVRITLSVLSWSLWFVSVMIILFSALDNFLLVGTSKSAAWPYAGIQNLMFGFFPLAKFFLKPVREHLRRSRKARKVDQPRRPFIG